MSGLLAQALLGGTAGAAKQVNDNWREKVKQAREDAIYSRTRNDQLNDYQMSRKDAITDYRKKKTIDQEFEKTVPVYGVGSDGKTLVKLAPGADGGLAGIPVYRGGDSPGYLSAGKSGSGLAIGIGGSSGKGQTISLMDANGQLVDDVKTVPGADNTQMVMVQVPVTNDKGQVIGSDLRYMPIRNPNKPAIEVTDDELSTLYDGRDNPEIIANFNRKFGAGAAERTLAALNAPTPQPVTPQQQPSVPPTQAVTQQPTQQPSPVTDKTVPTFSQAQTSRPAGQQFSEFVSGLFGDQAEYYAKKGDWASVAQLANPTRYQQLVAQYGGS